MSNTTNDRFLPPALKEKNTDFDYTRKNMYDLIETAMAGIQDFVPVAQQSQNARAYEVLFNAIKTAAELNEKLADHSVKKEEATKEEKPLPNGDTIHNTLNVTTADFAKMLQNIIDKKND